VTDWRKNIVRIKLALLLGATSICGAHTESTELLISYIERPPYYYTGPQGELVGFLGLLTREIMTVAGIDAHYVQLPVRRILAEVQRDHHPHCSIGWYRNPERDKFASFSLSIFSEPPIIALVRRSDQTKMAKYQSLAQLVQQSGLIAGIMKNFSYGTEVDHILNQHIEHRALQLERQEQLLRLLAAGRVDYLLVAPPEVEGMITAAGLNPADFLVHPLADVHSDNERYLMCNKSLDPEMMAQINRAIVSIHTLENQKLNNAHPLSKAHP